LIVLTDGQISRVMSASVRLVGETLKANGDSPAEGSAYTGRMSDETVLLGDHLVHRVGFGAMQLPGPRVFSAIEALGAREDLDISAFVNTWSSDILQVDRDDAQLSSLARKLREHLGSRFNTDHQIAETLSLRLNPHLLLTLPV